MAPFRVVEKKRPSDMAQCHEPLLKRMRCSSQQNLSAMTGVRLWSINRCCTDFAIHMTMRADGQSLCSASLEGFVRSRVWIAMPSIQAGVTRWA